MESISLPRDDATMPVFATADEFEEGAEEFEELAVFLDATLAEFF